MSPPSHSRRPSHSQNRAGHPPPALTGTAGTPRPPRFHGNPRRHPILIWLLGLALLWLVAAGGYWYARSTRMTADKVVAYLRSVDFRSLQGEARARAIRELVRRLNALSWEERREARLAADWGPWFEAMTEAEQTEFIEATLPTGFKQVLNAFEELPEAQRRRTIDDAAKRLREAQQALAEGGSATDTSADEPPVISEEVRQAAIRTGLKTYYSESSAQMKAELAPLLEEMQRMMESGVFLRRRWEGRR